MTRTSQQSGRWPVRRLGDVLIRHNEVVHPGERTGEVAFVGLEHIEPNSGRRIGSSTIDLGSLTGRKPTFRRGQIVYGYLRPYLNKVWVAEFDGYSSVDQFAFDVRPDLAVTEFVAAFMRSDTFLNRASIVTTTGQLPRIGTEEIAAVPIELPPLDVQQRVSSELGERLGSAERARRASQERLAAVRALSAAYLREVFEGRSAAGWRTVALEDLVQTPIRTGLSKPARPDSATRCLTLSAVRGRTLILEESKPVDVADDDAERNRLRPGCFYVVRGNGNRELVGRGSFAPDIVPDGILFPDLLFEVNLSGAVDRSFFWCQWSSPAVRDALSERARTAAGIYKINTVGLRSMRLRLPDLAEQRQVAHGLLKRIDEAATLQSACCDEAKLLDALRPALLRACFDGGA